MWVKLFFLAAMIASAVACSSRVEYGGQHSVSSSAENININVATADELEKFPGIGRKTADAIISFRNENGPFRCVEHLMLIRGVSEARFGELRPFLHVE